MEYFRLLKDFGNRPRSHFTTFLEARFSQLSIRHMWTELGEERSLRPSSHPFISCPCSSPSPTHAAQSLHFFCSAACLFAELMAQQSKFTSFISYNLKLNWVPKTHQHPSTSAFQVQAFHFPFCSSAQQFPLLSPAAWPNDGFCA